jgi:hypothetical protein
MRFVWLPRCALFAAMGLALLTGGCVTNDISLSITQFVLPTAGATTCMYPPTGATTLPRGTYDITAAGYFGTGYTAAFEVQNNLEELMGADVETQALEVSSYNVTLEVIGDLQTVIPMADRAFNYATSTLRLSPSMTGIGFAQLIGPDQVPAISSINTDNPGSIIAHIQPVVTNAGTQSLGAAASFPVDFCKGCLLGLTSGGSLPACPLMVTTPNLGNPCNEAADLPITCCQPSGTGAPLCGTNVLPQT